MTTRPGCESSCPHPAAGARSSRAGREAAGGEQTPCACVPRSRVTSAGLGRTELVATLLTPQLQPTQGRSPGKLCEPLRWLSQVRPAHGHPACGGQAPRPRLRRTGGAVGTAAAEGCGGRDHQKGFGWGDGLTPVLCPEGSLTPPAAQGAGKPGSTRREPTLQPLQAVLLQKAPTGLISLLNTRMRSAMPLFPCTHVGRQALLSRPQRLTEGQHWSCASATASPSAYLPVSAEVPISGAARHPQHPHRKVNVIV